jgi:CRISPR-associated protein (TIGR03986 family)
MNKHDERVFLCGSNDPCIPLMKGDPVIERWKQLIEDYQELHDHGWEGRDKDNGEKPNDYLGHDPGKTGWSRQVHTPGVEQLTDGILCYARVKRTGATYKILDLFPVSISREIFPASPEQLLPQSLHPATVLEKELSPADRVFGWASQDGFGAYRGQLRIGPLTCTTSYEDAVEEIGDDGLALAILGEPKPQQARFYVAENDSGAAQKDGLKKLDAFDPNNDAAYRTGKGLRGRKVYPHHQDLPEKCWDISRKANESLGGKHLEYRRQGGGRDKQNRSIQAWVKPKTEFTFDIDLINLSDVELGTLLYLLTLPEGCHRLGGGKPLGFGSVRLELDGVELRDGAAWRAYYSWLIDTMIDTKSGGESIRLDDYSKASADEKKPLEDIKGAYKKAVAAAYGKGQPFEKVPFIAAFEKAAKGFDDGKPIHYPRTTKLPTTDGESFKWFAENEKTKGNTVKYGIALGDLETDKGLPILEKT